MGDPFRDRMEKAGEFPPAWKPAPGELIVGELVDFVPGIVTQYGPCDVAHVKNEDTGAAVSVWLSGAVLKNEWAKLAPRLGERVGIRFLGERELKGGGGGNGRPSKYRAYVVKVDRPDTMPAGRTPEPDLPPEVAEDLAHARAGAAPQAVDDVPF